MKRTSRQARRASSAEAAMFVPSESFIYAVAALAVAFCVLTLTVIL